MNEPGCSPETGSKKGFWVQLKKVADRNVSTRPCFSGARITESISGMTFDSRENIFVRTCLIVKNEDCERIYQVLPTEFSLDRDVLQMIGNAISTVGKEPPGSSIMEKEGSLRGYVEKKVARDLSFVYKNVNGPSPQVLSRICVQYTVGYGVLEHMLRDERVQDIYIEPPHGSNPVHINIGGMDRHDLNGSYKTNVVLEIGEVDRLVSLLRFNSGRPFSEANPVLECDLPVFNARVTAVSPPLSPGGISIAIRKHSHDPWTLLRLIGSGSIDSYAAAFLDLCMDGRSTMLIAGPRGAGKSSLLGALLFDIDPATRIITIEDTQELPIGQLSSHGFNVLGLTVEGNGRSTADKALRTALRLGESVLVLGEVRGPETRTLYDAMSAGTAGSAVLGTFHADSSSSVYKRAVEDLGVSSGSFSATDIVIICGLVQPKGLRTRYRRVVQISEYLKSGKPGRFRDLFKYDPDTGGLIPATDIGSSLTMSRISSLWGISVGETMEELETRRRVFDHTLRMAKDHFISRPLTMVHVLNALREAREVKGGRSGKVLFKEWKKRVRFDESEDWEK